MQSRGVIHATEATYMYMSELLSTMLPRHTVPDAKNVRAFTILKEHLEAKDRAIIGITGAGGL